MLRVIVCIDCYLGVTNTIPVKMQGAYEKGEIIYM